MAKSKTMFVILWLAGWMLAAAAAAAHNQFMIAPEMLNIRKDICERHAAAERAFDTLNPLHRFTVNLWLVEFQNEVIGPRIYGWLNEMVRANSSLISGILLTSDAPLFWDVLKYVQFGDPNPFVGRKELVNPCAYTDDLIAIIGQFKNTLAAMMTQLMLKSYLAKVEDNAPILIKEFIARHQLTFDLLRNFEDLKNKLFPDLATQPSIFNQLNLGK